MSNVGRTYKTADAAFRNLYDRIHGKGEVTPTGMRLVNEGFYITNPTDNIIKTPFRKWNPTYAKREWDWYKSENRSVSELKKYAPIWDKMHSGDDIVNSNYGYQWNRNNQLTKVMRMLHDDPHTRRAWLTIHDGKEMDEYEHDTPCTLSIGFNVTDENLNMQVLMRSNDLWFGFCNDQYCFSELQKYVARMLKLDVGYYFHYAADLHLYKQQLYKFNDI